MAIANYTGRDFTARYESLLTQFRALVPELTDLNHSNPGIALIRLLASESDFLSYYIDQVFSSGYVETAQFKQMIINLARSIDMLPKLAAASRTSITATRINGVTGAITIPQFTAFTRRDNLPFLTEVSATIAADEDSVDIPVMQGGLVEMTLSIDDFESIDQTHRLKYNLGTMVASGSVNVATSSTQTAWTEVESYYRTTAEDLHFTVELYADQYNGNTDTAFLTLCKKDTDSLLPSSLDVSFVRCNGSAGNTGANTITVCPSPLDDYITVSNSLSSTGGSDPETTGEIRTRMPLVARMQRRAVTKEDYVGGLLGIAGVKYVEANDRVDAQSFPYEHILLYVTPSGGGAMSSQLRQEVLSWCAAYGHLGPWVNRYVLQDSTQQSVDITARVGISSGSIAQTVIANISTMLQSTYSMSGSRSLKAWTFSDIHSAISQVSGVSWVEISQPITNVYAMNGEILSLGTITITQGT